MMAERKKYYKNSFIFNCKLFQFFFIIHLGLDPQHHCPQLFSFYHGPNNYKDIKPFTSPLLPYVNKYRGMYLQCITGGEGIGLCGEHIQKLYTLCLARFRNLQNCFTTGTPNKNLEGDGGPQTYKHLPPSPFTGQFLRKAEIQDWSLLVIQSVVFSFCRLLV